MYFVHTVYQSELIIVLMLMSRHYLCIGIYCFQYSFEMQIHLQLCIDSIVTSIDSENKKNTYVYRIYTAYKTTMHKVNTE